MSLFGKAGVKSDFPGILDELCGLKKILSISACRLSVEVKHHYGFQLGPECYTWA